MKQLNILAIAILLLAGCKQGNESISTVQPKITTIEGSTTVKDENEEDEDGIREAQEMEFERTKDLSLGIVPKDRLLAAEESILAARRNGSYTQRVSALSWTERGSNNDVNGPFGNGRINANEATSGRIRVIWLDLADASKNTVWIGGVAGGIWHTNNIAADPSSWISSGDAFQNMAVADITQDPTNTNIMYFATGEKTYNADAVRGGGIFKSTNHGATWSLLANTTTFYNASRIVCDATGNVYVSTIAGTGGSGGIFRSTDQGATWSASICPAGATSRVSEMTISSTGRMHVTTGYYNSGTSGNYYFTDNPSTVTSGSWTLPTTNFSPQGYNCDIAVNGNTVYACPAQLAFKLLKCGNR